MSIFIWWDIVWMDIGKWLDSFVISSDCFDNSFKIFCCVLLDKVVKIWFSIVCLLSNVLDLIFLFNICVEY